MPALPVHPARLLDDLDQLRGFGRHGSGVARMAFSAADIAARQWLAQRIEAAGLRAVADPCGNLFGLPPGDGPCLLVGSHSDTQPLGGWLDGAYGVICGLELARAAAQSGGPRIAVVNFQEEEGRFGGLAGSAVWAGQMSLAEADAQRDADGISFGEARHAAAGIAAAGTPRPEEFIAFIEPHIEQGPVLDRTGECIGIVEAIVGVRSWTFGFTGEANHAGTTPMPMRRDAVQALGQFIHELNAVFAPLVTLQTVWTLGRLTVQPNAPSVVPGAATVSVQMRDAEPARLEAMKAAALALAQRIANARGLALDAAPGLAHCPAHARQAQNARQHADVAVLDHIGVPAGPFHIQGQLLPYRPAAGQQATNGKPGPKGTGSRRIGKHQKQCRHSQDETDRLIHAPRTLPIPPGLGNPYQRHGKKNGDNPPVAGGERRSPIAKQQDGAAQQQHDRAQGITTGYDQRDGHEQKSG